MSKETMTQKLGWLMDKFSNDGWGYTAHATVLETDEETGEVYEECGQQVSEAIADLFHANGYTDENFSVAQQTWDTSPATDEGFVSVAWCENGKLFHEVYELYN